MLIVQFFYNNKPFALFLALGGLVDRVMASRRHLQSMMGCPGLLNVIGKYDLPGAVPGCKCSGSNIVCRTCNFCFQNQCGTITASGIISSSEQQQTFQACVDFQAPDYPEFCITILYNVQYKNNSKAVTASYGGTDCGLCPPTVCSKKTSSDSIGFVVNCTGANNNITGTRRSCDDDVNVVVGDENNPVNIALYALMGSDSVQRTCNASDAVNNSRNNNTRNNTVFLYSSGATLLSSGVASSCLATLALLLFYLLA